MNVIIFPVKPGDYYKEVKRYVNGLPSLGNSATIQYWTAV